MDSGLLEDPTCQPAKMMSHRVGSGTIPSSVFVWGPATPAWESRSVHGRTGKKIGRGRLRCFFERFCGGVFLLGFIIFDF